MTTVRTPTTPASKTEKTPTATPGGSKVKKENILVTVRLRPLSKKEKSFKDKVAWECIDDHTIVFKPYSQERSNSSTSFSFDKVFGPACPTDIVYEEGAKEVALSAARGINATIFAYGQTSSGKTYTMRGITESAVNDIYKQIESIPERNFIIKISALEIYNEIVRDLLKPDSGPLRLLDDPEKGTIVEKLEEETAKDSEHLRHLIGICEAQRQIGETALNDTSSRSHQIIRLTVESSLRENSDCVKAYVANLNFVDLAGSERASQTNAEGARLKEGCHINLSLLTLTTVIRKLSDGKKTGHIPYRQSKLTRILQHSLGGNSRTAIICTMSPALSHVEQSRITLSFASCAKEVTNSAQVNMVVSEKQLVKQLQMEVARLESELRAPETLASPNSEVILLEKEMQIKKMEIEMDELKRERDLAKSQLDELRRKTEQGRHPFESSPRRVAKCLTFSGQSRNPLRQSSTVPSMLVHEIRKLEQLQVQLGEEANRALEVLQKEVACHRLGNQDAAETIARLQAEIKEVRAVGSLTTEVNIKDVLNSQKAGANLKEEITRLHSQGNTIANLEERLENVQKSLDKLIMSLPNNNLSSKITPKSSKTASKKRKMLPLTSSGSVNLPNLIRVPCSPLSSASKMALDSEIENKPPENDSMTHENFSGSEMATPSKSEDGGDISSREGTPGGYRRSSSVNMKKMQRMFQNAAEENVRSIKAYVTELKERVAKLQYQKQLLVCQVLELEANEATGSDALETNENIEEFHRSPDTWQSIFNEQMQQIIQLWDVCHVSIIHRTQFFLLFRGDPADQIYVEVELRRLNWLQQHFASIPDSSPAQSGDEPSMSLFSSVKALRQEREFLSKRMNSRLTEEERRRLYIKWQVPLEGKQRKLQLVNKLWTDPNETKHIEESADIVARLVGFCEGGGNVTKEMFELNFAFPETKKPWLLGWQPISNFLRL
ncbi:Kinesin-like protein NACK1 [Apostasia shenzhenica]|uniref:Kinesin-like protein NACK1 n=1 Tax=Apostasia shenzhenica TaxID=1088818 RepID=A0A2I0AIM2_9ASPA|nr:Kinesin-like protein NACK1 [Apostasia shenzhenica]